MTTTTTTTLTVTAKAVVHKVGNCYLRAGKGEVYLLCASNLGVTLFDMKDGLPWRDVTPVDKKYGPYTEDEWSMIVGTFETFTMLDSVHIEAE